MCSNFWHWWLNWFNPICAVILLGKFENFNCGFIWQLFDMDEKKQQVKEENSCLCYAVSIHPWSWCGNVKYPACQSIDIYDIRLSQRFNYLSMLKGIHGKGFKKANFLGVCLRNWPLWRQLALVLGSHSLHHHDPGFIAIMLHVYLEHSSHMKHYCYENRDTGNNGSMSSQDLSETSSMVQLQHSPFSPKYLQKTLVRVKFGVSFVSSKDKVWSIFKCFIRSVITVYLYWTVSL